MSQFNSNAGFQKPEPVMHNSLQPAHDHVAGPQIVLPLSSGQALIIDAVMILVMILVFLSSACARRSSGSKSPDEDEND